MDALAWGSKKDAAKRDSSLWTAEFCESYGILTQQRKSSFGLLAIPTQCRYINCLENPNSFAWFSMGRLVDIDLWFWLISLSLIGLWSLSSGLLKAWRWFESIVGVVLFKLALCCLALNVCLTISAKIFRLVRPSLESNLTVDQFIDLDFSDLSVSEKWLKCETAKWSWLTCLTWLWLSVLTVRLDHSLADKTSAI